MTDYTKAISSLLYKFQIGGFYIDSVNDGAETVIIRYSKNQREARKNAVDVVCSVDVSSVCIKDLDTKKSASLFIVLGNEKCEILCDYSAPRELMPRLESIADTFANQWEGK